MNNKKGLIILDGRPVDASDEVLAMVTPGIRNLRGAFETMRVYNGKIFGWQSHAARMDRCWKLLGLSGTFNQEASLLEMKKALKRFEKKNCRIRFSVWVNQKKRHCAICCFRLPTDLRYKQAQGITAIVSSYKRNKTKTSHVKSLQYGLMRQALLEAKAKGADEALLFNNKHDLAEGSCSNIFVVTKNKVFTPPVSSGCLTGVTRSNVLDLARSLNLKVQIKPVSLKMLKSADEAFCTNSLIEVAPLIQIGRKIIGKGTLGAITEKMQIEYKLMVNRELGQL